MDRVFLDANVLFSAAWSSDSSLRRLWTLPNASAVLVVSEHAITEARRNLPDAKHPALEALLNGMEVVPTLPKHVWRPIEGIELPEGDMAILQAAVTAKCSHLLTGDRRHFGPYFGRTFAGVRIVPPRDYLRPLPDEAERANEKAF